MISWSLGVIGPPGLVVGRSTIMNELYGYDASSPGMLSSFPTQTEQVKSMGKHCTSGIDLRISNERVILLDAQPVYSPSVLIDMMRPDGSSTIPVLNGDALSADLADELMGIQVDLLKHNIPDPSLLMSAASQDKENKNDDQSGSEDYISDLCFVHASSSAIGQVSDSSVSSSTKLEDLSSSRQDIFLLPLRGHDSSTKFEYGTHSCMLGMLCDQALERSEYWRLSNEKGKPPGVLGWWPSRAVTFMENHDTGSTQVIFRATYWSRTWSQMSNEEENMILKEGCRKLEGAALEVFSKFGWNVWSRIEA